MDGLTHGRTDNVKTVYPLQTKFAGGITIVPVFGAAYAAPNIGTTILY